jgi:hypothetical protein
MGDAHQKITGRNQSVLLVLAISGPRYTPYPFLSYVDHCAIDGKGRTADFGRTNPIHGRAVEAGEDLPSA